MPAATRRILEAVDDYAAVFGVFRYACVNKSAVKAIRDAGYWGLSGQRGFRLKKGVS